jgi:hypothetical protein
MVFNTSTPVVLTTPQEFQMEVVALLFASKYGVAALATVTLAITLLGGTLSVLARKANQR